MKIRPSTDGVHCHLYRYLYFYYVYYTFLYHVYLYHAVIKLPVPCLSVPYLLVAYTLQVHYHHLSSAIEVAYTERWMAALPPSLNLVLLDNAAKKNATRK